MFVKATESTELQVDLSKREVTAYFARHENIDRAGDVGHQGMFAKTLGPNGRFKRGLVAVKYNHRDLIGYPRHIEDDAKGGLAVMRISPTPMGDEKLALMQDGALPTLSYKYTIDPNGDELERVDGRLIRHLKSVEVWELGPVDPDLAVNDETSILSIKGLADVSASLSALTRLDYAELEAIEISKWLSDEEREALQKLLASLPSVGETVRKILGVSKSEKAFADLTKAILAREQKLMTSAAARFGAQN